MNARPVLAADIGGTQMRAAIVDARGKVLVRQARKTQAHADAPAALIELILEVGGDHRYGEASHAVIGLPGDVDYHAGRLLYAPHLPPGWSDLLARDLLSERLGLATHLANDVDLAAVGEAAFGAGRDREAVAYLTISTGIGAGVVQSGRLVHGPRSLGEVGHTVIDWQAWRALLPSTLEELGSGSGVARLAREAGLGQLDAHGVELAAASGDPAAVRIWDGAITACAIGVLNVVMAFSPSTVIIGGGIGRQPDFFHRLSALVESRQEHFPADFAMVRSLLGDDAALVGAANWAAALGEAD
jgi:glucokinase